jgi:hypothetical protein
LTTYSGKINLGINNTKPNTKPNTNITIPRDSVKGVAPYNQLESYQWYELDKGGVKAVIRALYVGEISGRFWHLHNNKNLRAFGTVRVKF